ncbi:MAG: addiction module protein [Candidatus Xenobia bacterium]
MTDKSKTLLAQALQLADKDRLELAAQLIHSVDHEADPQAEQLWSEEIARRIADEDAGQAEHMTTDEALRFIRSPQPRD